MRRDRTDKLGEELRRIQRNRRLRGQQRELTRAFGDESAVEQLLEDTKDAWEFSSQELGAIERQAKRDVGHAFKDVGRELLDQGVEFTADLFISLATLGFVAPTSADKRRNLRRNRERRN